MKKVAKQGCASFINDVARMGEGYRLNSVLLDVLLEREGVGYLIWTVHTKISARK